MINYSMTQEIITPESAENGEAETNGYISEHEQDTFRDMIKLLKYTEPSCFPLNDDDTHVWFTSYGEADITGNTENISFHPLTERDCRYMIKAWKYNN